jgi:hypothetical protein
MEALKGRNKAWCGDEYSALSGLEIIGWRLYPGRRRTSRSSVHLALGYRISAFQADGAGLSMTLTRADDYAKHHRNQRRGDEQGAEAEAS